MKEEFAFDWGEIRNANLAESCKVTKVGDFRIGIIGFGKIAQVAHVPAILTSGAATLTAIVESKTQDARDFCRELGLQPKISTAIDDIVDCIDAAIVATPNHLHCQNALACLRAGRSVLIEKPLATSVEAGEAIVAAAQETGCLAAVAYATRYEGYVDLLKMLIDEGYFGRIRGFAYQYGTRGGWAPSSGYNLDRTQTGGGVLIVTGTHFIDRMLYWFGMPAFVEHADDGVSGPEANSRSALYFQRDGETMKGTLRFSKTFSYKNGMVMDTDAGIVIVREETAPRIRLFPRTGPEVVHTVEPRTDRNELNETNVFERQLQNFVAACKGESSLKVNATQGVMSLHLIEWLYSVRVPLHFPNEIS